MCPCRHTNTYANRDDCRYINVGRYSDHRATLTPATTATSLPTSTPAPNSTLAATATSVPSPTNVVNLCKLPEAAAPNGAIGLGFRTSYTRMITSGTVRAKVLFVDFSDAPAKETPAETFARISPGAPDFYKALSYGRMTYQLEPHLVWLRMSKPSSEYFPADRGGITFALQRAYMQEAINLADAAVDFSGVQAVEVMANPEASTITYGPAFNTITANQGFVVDGTTILKGATSGVDIKNWKFLWLNHEAGHTLGLVDLYLQPTPAGQFTHQFVGDFSMMGFINGKAPELLAYERWLLGWLDDSQVVCQSSSTQTTTLAAIETPGGVKAVMGPTGKTTGVMVESRRALGYDNKLAKPGALVYLIDTSIKSSAGPIKVLPVIAGDQFKSQSPLAVGQSVTVDKVTITVTASDANGDTVQVTIAP